MCIVECRCPGYRGHGINGEKFETCGSLMGAIDTESSSTVFFRCSVCRKMWKVEYDYNTDHMVFSEVKKGNRIKMEHRWKEVRHAEDEGID